MRDRRQFADPHEQINHFVELEVFLHAVANQCVDVLLGYNASPVTHIHNVIVQGQG